MIISQVIGGLGNQMFQYAVGRAISLERGLPLRLDISGFTNYGLHQGFELSKVFNCPIDIATKEEIKNVLGCRSSSIFRKLLRRSYGSIFRGRHLIIEPHYHYWAEIKNISQDSYLSGYWQSEKYFQDIAVVIRTDFTFKIPLEGRNAELAKQIDQVNAVSLHVRRGDYVTNSRTRAVHGLCQPDYYQNAVRHVYNQVEQPVFFIFSDDMAWVKEHLKIDAPCFYVDHNCGTESYNDMRLMSLCRHHIIANSSFSWWGAWLNPTVDKIVVAPRKWFTGDANTADLFPENWMVL